ncbi:coiled-coil domain-containing protein [Paenibacillus hexagrammi]|uniref:Uncharacterized protein n=1 Tax=Paenibacillus hexagrammi TaxID=2908839 RepID=A0ABY3SNV9_9BACL|nr:hypothetical protein [Paenibacillus sp. YPD9-1]UJF35115.1 hypothetical protein L0M14_08265 [Paenibacillus sp. YPD9-1]
MRYWYKPAIVILSALLIWSSHLQSLTVFAEEDNHQPEDTKELLQKGLTIYEVDREIERLNQKDGQITNQIGQNEADIAAQKQHVQVTKEHAGKVLRAYYMGDRDTIWTLLFSVTSISDAIRMFEYIQMIISNDHRSLAAYSDSYDQLKQLQSKLAESHVQLQETKEKWLQQRQRLVQLQEELDKQLAVTAQANVIQQQIQSLNDQWKAQGLPLFRQYFNQLSVAFSELPQYIMQNNADNKYLNLSSLNNPLITISDDDFNQYLHQRNEQLKDLTFEFKDDGITASGKTDGMTLQLQGQFAIVQGVGMNEVHFIIDRIDFNGFELPDTTIEDMMKEFKLGFVPKKLVNYLDVVDVETKDKKVIVKLKLSF